VTRVSIERGEFLADLTRAGVVESGRYYVRGNAIETLIDINRNKVQQAQN